MAFATRGNLVWLGMILAGMALGAYVLTSWPDTSTRLIRLPYGESMPKTPRVAAKAPAVKVARSAPAAPKVELTAAEPAPKPAALPKRAPAVAPAKAPVEIVSEETASELGAEPLPGMGQSKPVEKKPAAAPTQAAPTAQREPAPAPEEPPAIEITVGPTPPSGQE